MIAETMDKPLAANEKVYRFGSLLYIATISNDKNKKGRTG